MKLFIFDLKKDLANYLKVRYAKSMKGDVLCLPVRSTLYRFVCEQSYNCTSRSLECPKDALVIGLNSLGNARNSVWHYRLSKKANQTFARMVDYQMRKELYAQMKENRYKYGISYVETVNRFISRYGLYGLDEETLLRGYRRAKSQGLPG